MIWDIFTYTVFWMLPLIGGIVLVAFFSLMGAHQAKPKEGEPAPPLHPEPPKKIEKPTSPILFDVEGDNRVRISTILYHVIRLLACALVIGLIPMITEEVTRAWFEDREYTLGWQLFYFAVSAGLCCVIFHDFIWWHSNKKPLGTFHAYWIQKNLLGGYITSEVNVDETATKSPDATVDAHVERSQG